ncbi:hypothetical protein TIFTF001_018837 [Ficus carica]|uniref:Uncharacterized protein n=1 Tax=Ficus carica TaxID=3494 RepID=A0AA88AD86_FICCA|nr:hypothetical protein TIFTF001_018837 [Ficus carica]
MWAYVVLAPLSDAEVAGCSVIRLELGFRGPGYPGETPQSDWDTGGVSATGTPMLKSVFLTDSGVRVAQSGRLPSASGWVAMSSPGIILPGNTEVLNEVVNPGRVPRLPGKSLMAESSRVSRIQFNRLDTTASI